MNFSVLISIYYKEDVDYFNRAMQSIWDEQIIKPNEIILVQDGPLTDILNIAIDEWKKKLGIKLKIVVIDKNIGLGDALNLGLSHCTYELVARMDTDDVADKTRFKKQLYIFDTMSIDICSSWISEFEDFEENSVGVRKLPEYHKNIIDFAKKRNPLNHPSVMFRKKAVEKAGNYQKMIGFEDYYLWVRMIISGAKFYNIQEALVNMRAGDAQVERRSGWNYAKKEILFQKELLSIGFINFYEFIRNIAIRFTIRVLPKSTIKRIYQIFRE